MIKQKIFPDANNILYQLQLAAVTKEFSEAKTNEARMKVTLKYYTTVLGKDNYIEQCFREVERQTNFKSKEKSEQLRIEGNKAYQKGDTQKALKLYTKSIAYAPLDSSELSLAYANRSAVLCSMKKCRECLEDIERALGLGYPTEKSFKLLLREMQCHRDLGNKVEVIASFKKASKLLLSLSGLTEKERTTLREQLIKEMDAPPKEVCKEIIIIPDDAPELSYGPSSEVLGASSAVKIEYNEQQGRHLVATRNIKIGDVLLIGEDLIGAVIDQHKYDHCTHCYKLCYSLLPCQNCVWVMFCSDKCQTEANKKYHFAECAAFSRFCHINGKLFFNVYDRIIRLLAMIDINNLQPYLKYARTNNQKVFKSMNKEAKRTKGFNSRGVFDPTNVDIIFNLVSKIEQRDQQTLLINSIFALQIPRCFGMSMEDPDFFAVAGLCLQLQDTGLLTNTATSYYDFRREPVQIISPADCFNPLSALVNHSCFCNLTFVQYGNKHVTLAKWPIPKGSILTESYNDFDISCPKETRQEITLLNALFVCRCEACKHDWRTQFCISDPNVTKLLSEMYVFAESVIVKWHKIHPSSYLAPIFDPFRKSRYDILKKLWDRGEFCDWRCEEIHYQLRVHEWLQGNRVIVPIQNAPAEYYQPELLTELNEMILETLKYGITIHNPILFPAVN